MARPPKPKLEATLRPKLSSLPQAQRRLWPELSATPPKFRLAGGTTLALHLGHRASIDFDFFAFEAVDTVRLLATVPYLIGARTVQIDVNRLTVVVDRDGPVSISFFGMPKLHPVAPAVPVSGTDMKIANLIEIAAFKAAVIPQRIEVKDYLDIAALLGKTDIALIDMLAAAAKLYGDQYNPLTTLQALSDMHNPGLAGLPAVQKRSLRTAVAALDPNILLAAMRKANIKGR